MDDKDYIDKVWSDRDFPSHPRDPVTKQFFLEKENAYIFNGKVKCDFVNDDGVNMRYTFHYDNPTKKGFSPHLIIGTEFI